MKLLFLFVGLVAVLSTCYASSESCSCEEEDIDDEITNVFIITAEDQKDLDKLLKKITKKKDCKDAVVKSVMNNLMFAATVRMSPDCAEEVDDWGYAIEPNALQFTEDMDEPWLRDRIDQRNLPLDRSPFVTSKEDLLRAADHICPKTITIARFSIKGGGEGVTIFILDTGVLTDHAEYIGRVEIYKDMLASDSSNPELGDPNGHGTRCAGAAIGSTIGIATKAQVKSIRVAGVTGSGSIEQSLLGFEEVKKWTEQNPGAKCVVSYSLSSKGISPSLDAAVRELSKTCVMVISAGNYGQDPSTADACLYSPGRVEEAITVGAARLRKDATVDDKAGFSCYGACVDIYAPGHKVELASSINPDDVIISSGTSFAAPAVAGAAAVLLGNGYDLTEVKPLILSTATRDKLESIPPGEGNLLLNVEDTPFRQAKSSV